jgi:hypothetical protein
MRVQTQGIAVIEQRNPLTEMNRPRDESSPSDPRRTLGEPRDQLARLHGFESYVALLSASEPLPILPGDAAQSYIAQNKNGHWFVWEDEPPAPPIERSRP